jgi:hypothetical protein
MCYLSFRTVRKVYICSSWPVLEVWGSVPVYNASSGLYGHLVLLIQVPLCLSVELLNETTAEFREQCLGSRLEAHVNPIHMEEHVAEAQAMPCGIKLLPLPRTSAPDVGHGLY